MQVVKRLHGKAASAQQREDGCKREKPHTHGPLRSLFEHEMLLDSHVVQQEVQEGQRGPGQEAKPHLHDVKGRTASFGSVVRC